MVASRRTEWDKKKKNPRDRIKSLIQGAKNRSKTKNIPFDLDQEYLLQMYNQQGGLCAIGNIPFDLGRPEQKGIPCWNAPSLDRVDPIKGYVKGNVRIVLFQINCGISSYGLEHFLELCSIVHTNNLGGIG